MESALKLLEILQAASPPIEHGHHYLFVENGQLHVGVWFGNECQLFRLDEADLKLDPVELAEQLLATVADMGG